jgi:hypothetical protein
MFVAIVGNRVYVSLSRRNLRQLDAMLDTDGGCIKCLTRKDESGVSLVSSCMSKKMGTITAVAIPAPA